MNYVHSLDHPLTTAHPYFPPEEQAWLQSEFLEIMNGTLSMGPRVAKFEQEFAAYCRVDQGVAFPSGTAALEAALIALGVEPGDDVLVPVETFIATAMAVHLIGARPQFTEISSKTFAMDFEDAWARVTDRTRGAIVVHFGGLIPAELAGFVAKMQATGRFVLEDAAHAHGAEVNQVRAGSLGDAACFSFSATKIMTTGEGGILVTSRHDVAEKARSLQNRGLHMTADTEKYTIPGRNNRFTEIAASMGLSQLRCLPDFLAARRSIAQVYDSYWEERELFRPLERAPASVPSYWRYVLISATAIDRKELKKAALSSGIHIDWPYDPPVHLQPVIQRIMGTRPGMFPRSEEVLSRHICLPIHARLRKADAEYVTDWLDHHLASAV